MTASESLRQRRGFVVAGLGKMGMMHASLLGVVPGGRVAALVDVDDKLGAHVRSMGIDAPFFSDISKCIDEIRPEGAWIATPQSTHRPLIEACIARGVPVFCEAPLAQNLAEAQKIASVAGGKSELPLAVGYMLAHNPLYRQARDLIVSGELGLACSFRASARVSQVFTPLKGWQFVREQSGGGALIDLGCHLLMALQIVFGRPARVTVKGRGIQSQVEDTVGAIIEYESGLWGVVDLSWSVPGHEVPSNAIEILGTCGMIEVCNEALRLWLHQKSRRNPAGWNEWPRSRTEPIAEFSLSPEYCGDEFFLEDKEFIEAVRKKGKPRVGIAEAIAIQEVIDAMYRSMAEGRTVTVGKES